MKRIWNDAIKNPPPDNRDIIVYVLNGGQPFYIAHHDIGKYIIRIESQEMNINGVSHWIDLPSFINPSYIEKMK